MHREFGMEDGGELNWYLGIGIERHPDGSYEIQQKQYLKDKCDEYQRYITHGCSNPLPTNFLDILKLAENSNATEDDFPYSEIVGSLMYAMIGTRPDLAMALSVVCRYMKNPKKLHCDLVKHILRYVSVNSYSLIYQSNPGSELVGWVDASYANREQCKSTTGFLFTFGKTAISWLSSKQPVVALSSCEAELIAANSAVQEAIWLKQLLSDIGVPQSTVSLMEDNEACIALSKDNQYHKRTKHIQVRFYYFREQIANEEVKLVYCQTKDQLADFLTKALPGCVLRKNLPLFGLIMFKG
jgi:hypothetical protein